MQDKLLKFKVYITKFTNSRCIIIKFKIYISAENCNWHHLQTIKVKKHDVKKHDVKKHDVNNKLLI